MSLKEHQLNIAQTQGAAGNSVETEFEEVDWNCVIRSFGTQHEMKFMETLKWISNRTSLQVACEVLGVALSPSIAARHTASDVRVLNSLGDFLSARGFQVPRLMEHRRMEYVRKGRERMGFSLSREEYLRERAAGKSKNKIAHQQGISGPALFHWLNKWGLKDSALEQREIDLLFGNSQSNLEFKECIETESSASANVSASTNVSASAARHDVDQSPMQTPLEATQPCVFYPARKLKMLTNTERERLVSQGMQMPDSLQLARTGTATDAATVSTTVVATARAMMDDECAKNLQSEDKSLPPLNLLSDDSEVQLKDGVCTIQLPFLGTGSSRDSLSTRTDVAGLSRDELMQQGLCMLQTAVGQAYLDLTALLGERVARQQIQTYVLHQVANFMRNFSTS